MCVRVCECNSCMRKAQCSDCVHNAKIKDVDCNKEGVQGCSHRIKPHVVT